MHQFDMTTICIEIICASIYGVEVIQSWFATAFWLLHLLRLDRHIIQIIIRSEALSKILNSVTGIKLLFLEQWFLILDFGEDLSIFE